MNFNYELFNCESSTHISPNISVLDSALGAQLVRCKNLISFSISQRVSHQVERVAVCKAPIRIRLRATHLRGKSSRNFCIPSFACLRSSPENHSCRKVSPM